MNGGERLIRTGALCALLGALTSGPLGLWLVQSTHPQPPWRDAATFVAAYHPIQVIPFILGFALVGGSVLLIAGIHANAHVAHRPRTTAALLLASAFAAMIVTNYAIQTTVVPALLRSPSPSQSGLLEVLTMSNPLSLGWAVEMWGYAMLGVATWLVAPTFGGSSLARWTGRLFALNGPVSIATAVMTGIVPGWVLSGVGLWAFAVWNLLFMLMTLGAFLTAALSRQPGSVSMDADSHRTQTSGDVLEGASAS